jgi:hypothetical protein
MWWWVRRCARTRLPGQHCKLSVARWEIQWGAQRRSGPVSTPKRGSTGLRRIDGIYTCHALLVRVVGGLAAGQSVTDAAASNNEQQEPTNAVTHPRNRGEPSLTTAR